MKQGKQLYCSFTIKTNIDIVHVHILVNSRLGVSIQSVVFRLLTILNFFNKLNNSGIRMLPQRKCLTFYNKIYNILSLLLNLLNAFNSNTDSYFKTTLLNPKKLQCALHTILYYNISKLDSQLNMVLHMHTRLLK